MAGRDYPVRFTPRGLSDAYDATDTFAGACTTLKNLIFDQSNPELMVARPGVGMPIASLAGQNSLWGGGVSWGAGGYAWGAVTFTTPTVITVQTTIGDTVYGMVSSGRNAGKDEPFVFSTTTGFITVSGVTSANTPTSPSTVGDWTPPTMAVIGSKIVFTHPGFSGANYFGTLDISVPTAPVWSAGNTTVNALPTVPTSVSNFNNRAWYSCGNRMFYSDVLVPGVMTNAGQSLTLGDPSVITGSSGLPVQTSSAGIVAALIVFKQFQIWQITGDAAVTGSLAQNFLTLNMGCIAPRTIVQTPIGTIFMSIDGPYYVSQAGAVQPLAYSLDKSRPDIQAPFQNAVTPTRAAAAYSGSVYRICLDTVVAGVAQTADYWFDITRRRWTGPHSFNYDCASQIGNSFIISSRNYGANLFKSQYLQSTSSTYTDNGVPITVVMQSSSFPKTENINEKQVIESTIELSSIATNTTYLINGLSATNAVIGTSTINVTNANSLWGGGSTWGSGVLWNAIVAPPVTFTIPWQSPLVFKKMGLSVTAQSSSKLAIGTFYAKYQDLGYTNG